MNSVRTLLAEIVDYAGLFPPASLDMATTVANYAAYAASSHAWMLGRLIVPLGRLEAFEREADGLLPVSENDMPWMISLLVAPVGEVDFAEAADTIGRFNAAHASPGRGLALIDTIETRASTPSMIEDALDAIPDDLAPYFEVPPGADPRGLITALAGTPGRAKVRTGGVTADAVPPTRAVLDFILACAAAGVAFKATAGLHHAVRGVRPLTYDPDPPRAPMHGFLNVFLAAAAVRSNLIDEPAAADLLEEADPAAFRFTEDRVEWNGLRLDTEHLALAREDFALAFGSCSFEEPVDDLIRLELL
ncbi:MAG: hypothetical protein D6693_01845 [Planctomycetota bacterium]|nr:MAG: hypothetical protein D6693_01845 [Planctomycetota bacterium]